MIHEKVVKPQVLHLLREQEVADILSVSLSSLRHARLSGHRKGRLTPPSHIKVGRGIRYRPEDVQNWLKANMHGSEFPREVKV